MIFNKKLSKGNKISKNYKNIFLNFFPRGKKGLGIGQVFIFIVAAITFALIMIFGYKAIAGFIQSGEDVQFVQFKTGLESSIKKIYTEYGSTRIETFTTPAEYQQICFVDMDKPFDQSLCDKSQAACTVWEIAQDSSSKNKGYDSVGQNVFFKPTTSHKIKVHHISIAPEEGKDFLCLPIKQGLFSVVLEGKGDHTELSRVPLETN